MESIRESPVRILRQVPYVYTFMSTCMYNVHVHVHVHIVHVHVHVHVLVCNFRHCGSMPITFYIHVHVNILRLNDVTFRVACI